MTVELWIELHASMTIECLFHRFGSLANMVDGERFDFFIAGQTSSNNGLNICMVPMFGGNLGYLAFIEDIVGQDNGEADIPLYWAGAFGRGRVAPPPDDPNIDWFPIRPDPCLCIEIPLPCDWWWYFWGWFFVVYHEDDGYYVLYFAICPTPIL
jgi:hypothetical protein